MHTFPRVIFDCEGKGTLGKVENAHAIRRAGELKTKEPVLRLM